MKQIDRVLEEVNYPLGRIKLVKCVGAHNEADWIEYNLANCYDEFDIIRVVEGAVVGRPNSTPDGHSTDNTVELIKNFPDPQGKIELYQLDRPFKSLEEQKQLFLELGQPDEWLMIVDVDEFYLEGDVERVRKAIHQHPMASEIIPTFLHFYRDFAHVRAPHPEWTAWHQRILRWRPGLRYLTHPVATMADGTCTYFSPTMQASRYIVPDLYIFHYGHVKSAEFHKMKAEFYRSELEKFTGSGGNASIEFDAKLDEFLNYKESFNDILFYDGPHPKVLEKHPQRYKIDGDSCYWVLMDGEVDTPHALRINSPDIKRWKSNVGYRDKMPTIPMWMLPDWGCKRLEPFYNIIEV